MFSFLALCVLAVINVKSDEDALIEELFPHHPFECNPNGQTYETSFSFLQGLGHGFVHAEPERIFFEYYFPAEHWVGFSTADQLIEDDADHCSTCYFNNYYPLQSNTNHSNLYPKCIEECLDDTIFVATVNSDEENLNNWNLIEFQIGAQKSKALDKKMYRIPKASELLELWGSQQYPYREYAHFEEDIFTVGHLDDQKEYIHARFWRKYDFLPPTINDDKVNEWVPFAKSPEGQDLYYPDSLCFISIASFYGGEYPYDDDALKGLLPGFYIDTEHLANIHCSKLNDIKVDCGQDWSFLQLTEEEGEELITDGDEIVTDDGDDTTYSDIGGETDTDIGFDTDSDIDSDIATDTESDTDGDIDSDIAIDTDTGNDTDTENDTDTDTGNDADTENDTDPDSNTDSTDSDSTDSTESAESADSTVSTERPIIKKKKESTDKPTLKPTVKGILSSTTKHPTSHPEHGEDCCSAISQISYDDINCFNISLSDSYIKDLEERWKKEKCGRPDKLPIDLSEGIKNSESKDSDCDHLWAYFNQIYAVCYKYEFIKQMKVYNHFKSRGGYQCFNKNTDECKTKEAEITNENNVNFNNFHYMDDVDDNDVDTANFNDFLVNSTEIKNNNKVSESELAEMEEDGGLTITSLGVLGLIIAALGMYVLYWFCCSNTAKGYRQSPHLYGAYYDDDIDTDEYQKNNKKQQYINNYNDRINGGHNQYHDNQYHNNNNNNNDDDEDEEDDNSDWSEDEQLGIIKDDHNNMDINNDQHKQQKRDKKKKRKKSKKHKKNKYKNNGGYDITINDVNSMPINDDDDDEEEDHDENDNDDNNGLDMNDAVEVTIDNDNNNNNNNDNDDDDEYYYDEENETLQNEEEREDK